MINKKTRFHCVLLFRIAIHITYEGNKTREKIQAITQLQ